MLYRCLPQAALHIQTGKGVLWRSIPTDDRYRLPAADLLAGVDCRSLPCDAGETGGVVFAPPYMHSPGGTNWSLRRSPPSCTG